MASNKVIVSKNKLDEMAKNFKEVHELEENLSLDQMIELAGTSVGSDGFPIKVFELPQVGIEGAMYEVPKNYVRNDEYIGNVYFNINLSAEEVIEKISKIKFIEDMIYVIIVNSSITNAIMFQKNEGAYLLLSLATEDVFFVYKDGVEEVEAFGFSGWNPAFNGIFNFNDTAISYADGLDVGLENKKIYDLVNVVSFDSGELVDYYRCDKVELKTPTAIPTTKNIEVDEIYLNVNMSKKDVANLIETSGVPLDGAIIYQTSQNNTSFNFVISDVSQYTGIEGWMISCSEDVLFIETEELANFIKESGGIQNVFTGWNPDFNGIYKTGGTINNTALYDDCGIFNEQLKELISLTPFATSTYTRIQKDGIPIKVKELPNESEEGLIYLQNKSIENEGVAVPTSGYLEKIYINTRLSISEVIETIKSLNSENLADGFAFICDNLETKKTLAIGSLGGYTITEFDNSTSGNTQYNYIFAYINGTAEVEGIGFSGWNPAFNGEYIFNGELVSESQYGSPVGLENENLKNIFSKERFYIEDKEYKVSRENESGATYYNNLLELEKEANVVSEALLKDYSAYNNEEYVEGSIETYGGEYDTLNLEESIIATNIERVKLIDQQNVALNGGEILTNEEYLEVENECQTLYNIILGGNE